MAPVPPRSGGFFEFGKKEKKEKEEPYVSSLCFFLLSLLGRIRHCMRMLSHSCLNYLLVLYMRITTYVDLVFFLYFIEGFKRRLFIIIFGYHKTIIYHDDKRWHYRQQTGLGPVLVDQPQHPTAH